MAYILPLWFFLFFRRLLPEVTERISAKLGHIFTYDCYLKNLVRTLPRIYPSPGAGAKRFSGPTLNLTERIYATEHAINNRKETCQSAGTFLHSPYIW